MSMRNVQIHGYALIPPARSPVSGQRTGGGVSLSVDLPRTEYGRLPLVGGNALDA